MKFIIDAQLPKSLSDFFNWKGFDSVHTIELPENNKTSDKSILQIAKDEERIVVTKDIDFLESFIIHSEPKKLVLVKTGNIPNKYLLNIFSKNLDLLVMMLKRSSLVEISKTDIAEHD